MTNKHEHFGKSKEVIRKQLCEHPNYSLKKGDTEQSDCIVTESGEWKVVFDVYTIRTHHNLHEFTRIRAPFLNADEFRFVIHKSNLLDSLAKLIGMQDIKIGHQALDEHFIIQSNDKNKIKKLLSDRELVKQILYYQPVYFGVRDDEGFFSDDFPNGVDELYLLMEGVISEIHVLNDVYEIYSHALHLLTHLDSAYEDDPKIVL